ncbi:hypothetical protein [Saliphagus sp. LR7]|uniref:hypothetical protein n=1 Tax=Saliphagus sp. LR7 TaxID=2282654 RepID=UPI0013009B73|nr:hypothetical protein [Saliphagus sp. LR7]
MSLDNGWASAEKILGRTRSCLDQYWLRHNTHDGAVLFNVDGLFVYYKSQAAGLVE